MDTSTTCILLFLISSGIGVWFFLDASAYMFGQRVSDENITKVNNNLNLCGVFYAFAFIFLITGLCYL